MVEAVEHPEARLRGGAGVTAPRAQIDWIRANLSNVTIEALGPGLHYLQEDYPDAIGRRIASWLKIRAPTGADAASTSLQRRGPGV